ncbi:rCG22816 [Rattus norvegicus]|nr:rCG22816 [Rattus norvegicus]
MRELLPR